jgi:toxin ParE1/3/4
MGREGRLRDSRELVVAGTPYVVMYRVNETQVEVMRVLHGAQYWPPEPPK